MSTAALKRCSPAEYLALERASETKHEFFDGEIVDVTGAKEAHNLIAMNVSGSLWMALKDRPCRVYPSDMRVATPSGLWTYPDVSIVCGEPRFEDDQRDMLLNPLLLIEVLSPSTEASIGAASSATTRRFPRCRSMCWSPRTGRRSSTSPGSRAISNGC